MGDNGNFMHENIKATPQANAPPTHLAYLNDLRALCVCFRLL